MAASLQKFMAFGAQSGAQPPRLDLQAKQATTTVPHILDLPDEILVAVFRAASWHAIPNARLVCHRFYNTSSQFQLPAFFLEPSHASLAKLHTIANHPILSKGLGAIHVSVAFYNETLLESVETFASHHSARLRAAMRAHPCQGSENHIREYNNRIRAIVDAWTALARPRTTNAPSNKSKSYQALLLQAFADVQRLHAEQQELLESGAFTSQVASAMALMPTAKKLVIHDHDLPGRVPFCLEHRKGFTLDHQLRDHDKLLAVLCDSIRTPRPPRRDMVMFNVARTAPAIPALLTDLDAAGARITSLEIDLCAVNFLARRQAFAEHRYPKIRSAMCNLEKLRFCYRVHWDTDPGTCPRREIEQLANFLATLLNVKKLVSLDVGLDLWGPNLDPSFSPPVSVCRAPTVWPCLSTVVLCGLTIQYPDLEHFLRCAKSADGRFVMRRIHLLDHSWAQVLDTLRQSHSLATLTAPSGAECETMSVKQYVSIFGPYYHRNESTDTEAERYIRGTAPVNPLRSPPASGPESECQNDFGAAV